jgi:predicted RNA-binding Zn-ribbon protein involved in translation (DUF1610 family)
MIYDFNEILGRGILAARAGNFGEAIKYLDLAAKIQPANPRVWLWLAAAGETPSEKRQYLQRALDLDPDLPVAKALLDSLDRKATAAGQGADLVIFDCPFCGGKQRFDPDLGGMSCESCGRVERLDLKDAAQAKASPEAVDADNWEALEGQADCGACGAKISIPAQWTTGKCPFCGSDLVTIQSATPGLVRPAAIVPFQVQADEVLQILGKSWKIPRAELDQHLDRRALTLSSVYLPFWAFDGCVQILCALEYRVEPVEYSSRERVIRKGQWPMEKSWYETRIDDFLVYAARSLSETAVAQILPFDLELALEYRPELLAGWQAERYQIALADAEVVAHKGMRDAAFRDAAFRGLFMEPSRMLRDDVLILDRTWRLVLLPVWIARRNVSGKIQRTLLNGQTAKLASPGQSRWKF